VRYALGFVGSSDTHVAGPGAGYKEFRKMSDNIGAGREEYDAMVAMAGNLVIRDFERQNSYYFAGSLVAVHATGKSRQDIWEALQQRRVYATSGERTLLWFDLVGQWPQVSSAEPLETLIQDPYRSFTCDPDPEGCTAAFDDPDFLTDGRPASYYVRVYQEPTPVFNADTLRCTLDVNGDCVQTSPCPGGYHGDQDNCLALDEETAWSSPIYLTPLD